jgi:hypothetical protein
MWKVISRNRRSVSGCTITESYNTEDQGTPRLARFTATIEGFQNFKIYEGRLYQGCGQDVADCVRSIQRLVESGDEAVFKQEGYWLGHKQGFEHAEVTGEGPCVAMR